jgi:hypothetical protein
MRIRSRTLAAGDLDHELLWLLVGAATLFVGGLWLATEGVPPLVCPLKTMTGLPCPTCGCTRALEALVAGDVAGAIRWNPAVVAGAALGAVYATYAAAALLGVVPRLRVVIAPRDATWLRAAAWSAVAALWLFLVLDGR